MLGTMLSLERKGSFSAATMIDNPHKCGAMLNRDYNYRVRMTAKSTRLTPEGYLLNNEHVQEYFDSTFGEKAQPWEAISCERLAIACCEGLAELVRKYGIDLLMIEVAIEGSNGAIITASWPGQASAAVV